MYIPIGHLIGIVLGFLIGYFLYLSFHHFRVSEGRRIIYFFLPACPLGILMGLFKSLSGPFELATISYFIGFFACLLVKTSKETIGDDIDDVKRRLNRVLIKAAKDGNVTAVHALLDAGADVNSKSIRFGEIALMVAAEKGHVEVVKLLLENDADVNAKDEYGRTALMETVRGACSEIFFNELKILRKENGAFLKYVPLKAIEIIKLLLGKNADINAKDKDGITALWLAADGGSLEVVNILLENGADINAKDINGRTALGAARRTGHEDVVQLLKSRCRRIDCWDESENANPTMPSKG